MKKYLLSLLMIASLAPVNEINTTTTTVIPPYRENKDLDLTRADYSLIGIAAGYFIGTCPPLLPYGIYIIIRDTLKNGLTKDERHLLLPLTIGVAAGLTVFGFAVYGIKKFINRNKEKLIQKEEIQAVKE
jgi:hypothetical protein